MVANARDNEFMRYARDLKPADVKITQGKGTVGELAAVAGGVAPEATRVDLPRGQCGRQPPRIERGRGGALDGDGLYLVFAPDHLQTQAGGG